jgi:hypothetical protein
MSPVPLQSANGPAIPLPRLRVAERKGRRHLAPLLLSGLPFPFSLRRFLVEPLRNFGRSATLGDLLHAELPLEVALPQPNLVAGLHHFRALRPVAVHIDFAAVDRLGRKGTRLEEPRGPQPLVEADLTGGRRLVVVTHRLLRAVCAVVVEHDRVVVDIVVIGVSIVDDIEFVECVVLRIIRLGVTGVR